MVHDEEYQRLRDAASEVLKQADSGTLSELVGPLERLREALDGVGVGVGVDVEQWAEVRGAEMERITRPWREKCDALREALVAAREVIDAAL